MMTKRITVALLLLALMAAPLAASASVHGGGELRDALANAPTRTPHLGDQGGQFTAKLNETQQIYNIYEWDHDYVSLGTPLSYNTHGGTWMPTSPGSGAITLVPATGTQENPYQLAISNADNDFHIALRDDTTNSIPRTGTYYVQATGDQRIYKVVWTGNTYTITPQP